MEDSKENQNQLLLVNRFTPGNPKPIFFAGRRTELNDYFLVLQDFLRDISIGVCPHHIQILKGRHGVGKTTFLLRLKKQVQEEFPQFICLYLSSNDVGDNIVSFYRLFLQELETAIHNSPTHRELLLTFLSKKNWQHLALKISPCLLPSAYKLISIDGKLQTSHTFFEILRECYRTQEVFKEMLQLCHWILQEINLYIFLVIDHLEYLKSYPEFFEFILIQFYELEKYRLRFFVFLSIETNELSMLESLPTHNPPQLPTILTRSHTISLRDDKKHASTLEILLHRLSTCDRLIFLQVNHEMIASQAMQLLGKGCGECGFVTQILNFYDGGILQACQQWMTDLVQQLNQLKWRNDAKLEAATIENCKTLTKDMAREITFPEMEKILLQLLKTIDSQIPGPLILVLHNFDRLVTACFNANLEKNKLGEQLFVRNTALTPSLAFLNFYYHLEQWVFQFKKLSFLPILRLPDAEFLLDNSNKIAMILQQHHIYELLPLSKLDFLQLIQEIGARSGLVFAPDISEDIYQKLGSLPLNIHSFGSYLISSIPEQIPAPELAELQKTLLQKTSSEQITSSRLQIGPDGRARLLVDVDLYQSIRINSAEDLYQRLILRIRERTEQIILEILLETRSSITPAQLLESLQKQEIVITQEKLNIHLQQLQQNYWINYSEDRIEISHSYFRYFLKKEFQAYAELMRDHPDDFIQQRMMHTVMRPGAQKNRAFSTRRLMPPKGGFGANIEFSEQPNAASATPNFLSKSPSPIPKAFASLLDMDYTPHPSPINNATPFPSLTLPSSEGNNGNLGVVPNANNAAPRTPTNAFPIRGTAPMVAPGQKLPPNFNLPSYAPQASPPSIPPNPFNGNAVYPPGIVPKSGISNASMLAAMPAAAQGMPVAQGMPTTTPGSAVAPVPPATAQGMPAATAGVPTTAQKTPATAQGMPVATPELPTTAPGSAAAPGIPATAQGMPATTPGTSSNIQGIPVIPQVIPAKLPTMPENPQAIPIAPQNLFSGPQAISANLQALPPNPQALPPNLQTLAANIQALANQANTSIPTGSPKFPSTAKAPGILEDPRTTIEREIANLKDNRWPGIKTLEYISHYISLKENHTYFKISTEYLYVLAGYLNRNLHLGLEIPQIFSVIKNFLLRTLQNHSFPNLVWALQQTLGDEEGLLNSLEDPASFVKLYSMKYRLSHEQSDLAQMCDQFFACFSRLPLPPELANIIPNLIPELDAAHYDSETVYNLKVNLVWIQRLVQVHVRPIEAIHTWCIREFSPSVLPKNFYPNMITYFDNLLHNQYVPDIFLQMITWYGSLAANNLAFCEFVQRCCSDQRLFVQKVGLEVWIEALPYLKEDARDERLQFLEEKIAQHPNTEIRRYLLAKLGDCYMVYADALAGFFYGLLKAEPDEQVQLQIYKTLSQLHPLCNAEFQEEINQCLTKYFFQNILNHAEPNLYQYFVLLNSNLDKISREKLATTLFDTLKQSNTPINIARSTQALSYLYLYLNPSQQKNYRQLILAWLTQKGPKKKIALEYLNLILPDGVNEISQADDWIQPDLFQKDSLLAVAWLQHCSLLVRQHIVQQWLVMIQEALATSEMKILQHIIARFLPNLIAIIGTSNEHADSVADCIAELIGNRMWSVLESVESLVPLLPYLSENQQKKFRALAWQAIIHEIPPSILRILLPICQTSAPATDMQQWQELRSKMNQHPQILLEEMLEYFAEFKNNWPDGFAKDLYQDADYYLQKPEYALFAAAFLLRCSQEIPEILDLVYRYQFYGQTSYLTFALYEILPSMLAKTPLLAANYQKACKKQPWTVAFQVVKFYHYAGNEKRVQELFHWITQSEQKHIYIQALQLRYDWQLRKGKITEAKQTLDSLYGTFFPIAKAT